MKYVHLTEKKKNDIHSFYQITYLSYSYLFTFKQRVNSIFSIILFNHFRMKIS